MAGGGKRSLSCRGAVSDVGEHKSVGVPWILFS